MFFCFIGKLSILNLRKNKGGVHKITYVLGVIIKMLISVAKVKLIISCNKSESVVCLDVCVSITLKHQITFKSWVIGYLLSHGNAGEAGDRS